MDKFMDICAPQEAAGARQWIRQLCGRVAIWGIAILTGAGSESALGIDLEISGQVTKIGSYKNSGVEYISVSELAAQYGENLSWDVLGVAVSYKAQEATFLFHVGSPFVRMDDSVYNMTYPAELSDGALFVPAQTFLPLFERAKGETFIYEHPRQRVRAFSGKYNIQDMTVDKKENGLLIEIYMSEELPYDLHESEGNWVNINFPTGKINAPALVARKSSKHLLDVNAYQFDHSAQLSIRLWKKAVGLRHKYLPESGRLQISVLEPDSSLLALHSARASDQANGVSQIGPDGAIDLVVIDAGHGGEDYGAIGSKGGREKDIALDIAKEVAQMIRDDGSMKALLTRDRDVFVPLEERAKIANDAKADLFISIHCNASPNRQARGSQVFFLAPAKNDGARALAQAENAAFLTENSQVNLDGAGDLSGIVNDMIQNVYEETSADLSSLISAELRDDLDIPSRGADQAGFVVLNRVYMPAVLVETAFISNRQEEKLLKDRAFRKKMATAIFEGLKRFKESYEARR